MKSLVLSFCLLIATQTLPAVSPPASSPPGTFTPASVSDKEVIEVAKFAIAAEEKVLGKDKAGAKLELVALVGAETQVVAGMNYKLQLTVKLNGEEKKAEAIVWWQAWRKPEPYLLTDWNWK